VEKLKTFASVILSILCAILILEGMYRIYRYVKHGHVGFMHFYTTGLFGNHDVYGYSLMPNFDSTKLPRRVRFGEEGRGCHLDEDIKINKMGFRGEEFSAVKKEGSYRILTMGGSTTYCIGDNDRTWPAYLGKILDVEVINGGVPNWESTHLLTRFKNEGIYLKPDLVIIHSGLHDVRKGANKLSYKYGLKDCPGQVKNVKTDIFPAEKPDFITKYSLLYGYVNVKMSQLDTVDKSGSVNIRGRLTVWKENISEIIDIAKENGSEIILVDFPMLTREGASPKERDFIIRNSKVTSEAHYDFLVKIKKLISKELHDIAKEKEVEIAEAEELFNRYNADEKITFFLDEMHLAEKGDFILAGCIANKIKEK